jgi:hypothetical protein
MNDPTAGSDSGTDGVTRGRNLRSRKLDVTRFGNISGISRQYAQMLVREVRSENTHK